MMRAMRSMAATVLAALVLLSVSRPAHAQNDPAGGDPLPVLTAAPAQAPPAPTNLSDPQAGPAGAITPGTRALAFGSTLLPGILLHGSGHFVLGRRQAAAKLFAMEGIGLGMLVAGAVPLVVFNASRYVARSSATLAGLGAGFFVISSLADVYGTAVPLDSRGSSPLTTPLAEAELGYRFNYAADAPDHLMITRLDLRWRQLHIQPTLWHALQGQNSRQRLLLGYRPYGPSADRGEVHDGSFIEITGAVTRHSFPGDGLTTLTWEVFSHGRLDLRRLDPAFEGMFGILGLGLGAQTFHYAAADSPDISSLLLLRTGFGVYLGGSQPPHGQILSYYDHRHDDYAAGINDRAIGIPGHVGFSGRGYFSQALGMSAMVELGASWVTGASLLVRSPL